LRWGEAFVVVYSVADRDSFQGAQQALQSLAQIKAPSFFSLLLLGNKRDLDHCRSVSISQP
jgi:Ras-related and estrogen-regulated growth inhibitor-like protein